MKVSIIIVNYNTSALLKSCIESVKKNTLDLAYEVIVVDNASTDDSLQMLKSNYPDVVVIQSAENLGFGKANNLGAKSAKGEYLWLLNSDTLLVNNAAKILAGYLDENSDTGICGGNLFDGSMKPATSFSQTMPGILADVDYFLFRLISRFKHGNNLYFNHAGKPINVGGFISGADLMIRKKVFFEVEGFDPDFFLYYEETELTYRVRKNGHNLRSVPEARIIHLEGGSETTKEKTLIFSFESKVKYYLKTGQIKLMPLAHFIFQLTAIERIFIYWLQKKTVNVNYWKMLMRCEKRVYHYRNDIIKSCK